jgi:arylsulfatase A-like enzyme
VKSSRFFGWIHFYDAHSPYAPPEPYRTRFVERPYLGVIAFVDSQIGRVRAFLDREGLLDRTVIVVIGDHGESLGDHACARRTSCFGDAESPISSEPSM